MPSYLVLEGRHQVQREDGTWAFVQSGDVTTLASGYVVSLGSLVEEVGSSVRGDVPIAQDSIDLDALQSWASADADGMRLVGNHSRLRLWAYNDGPSQRTVTVRAVEGSDLVVVLGVGRGFSKNLTTRRFGTVVLIDYDAPTGLIFAAAREEDA